METYDVVVVGAGLAGLHAARAAARRGLAAHIFFGRGSFPETRYPSRFNAARRASPRWLPKPLP
jgi:flavin-dependent dehydrogenase